MPPALSALIETPSLTDRVYDALYHSIMKLELPPGAKVSEADAAKRLDVSRQSVRDAFYRLSEIGLLRIQPQRATTVTLILPKAVLDARFTRCAIEIACLKSAIERIDEDSAQTLKDLVKAQSSAMSQGDRTRFHDLDDAFHKTICDIADQSFAWQVIRQMKVHMDRVRYIAQVKSAKRTRDDHQTILDAILARDCDQAVAAMELHLSRIIETLNTLRKSHPEHFAADPNGTEE